MLCFGKFLCTQHKKNISPVESSCCFNSFKIPIANCRSKKREKTLKLGSTCLLNCGWLFTLSRRAVFRAKGLVMGHESLWYALAWRVRCAKWNIKEFFCASFCPNVSCQLFFFIFFSGKSWNVFYQTQSFVNTLN